MLTSATLELGGVVRRRRGHDRPARRGCAARGAGSTSAARSPTPSRASPTSPGTCPPPGRDGLATETLDEIEALVRAAGGRTLGLFSSMRAAKEATEAMRERFADLEGDIAFLCQGEDQISTLVRQFARDPRTCLFGTLSLWQGVDVPGSSCQLVIIDRIPFPRPDDPLASARSQAIARMGGNGFMAVSATHAALRLAQGAGRLIRRADDRGVVAFLDNRMMTARYAGFLQRSLPPFWPTADRAMVLAALERLDETAEPPQPVAEPALRGLTGAVAAPVGDTDRGADAAAPVPVERPVAEDPPPPESSRTAVTPRPRVDRAGGRGAARRHRARADPRRARRVDGAARRGRLGPAGRARARGRQRPDAHLRLGPGHPATEAAGGSSGSAVGDVLHARRHRRCRSRRAPGARDEVVRQDPRQVRRCRSHDVCPARRVTCHWWMSLAVVGVVAAHR